MLPPWPRVFPCREVIPGVPEFYLDPTLSSDEFVALFGWHRDNEEERQVALDRYLYLACRTGYIALVHRLIAEGATSWNDGLVGACEGGHMPIVLRMISLGANAFDAAMVAACRGGHDMLVYRMMFYNAHSWDEALEAACESGSEYLAALMIQQGAKDVSRGLYAACRSGNEKLVTLCVDNGADTWLEGMEGACLGGHLVIAQTMHARYCESLEANDDVDANEPWAFTVAFYNACQSNSSQSVELVEFIWNLHPSPTANLLLGALNASAIGNTISVMTWVLEKARDLDTTLALDAPLHVAATRGNVQVVEYLVRLGALRSPKSIEQTRFAGYVELAHWLRLVWESSKTRVCQ